MGVAWVGVTIKAGVLGRTTTLKVGKGGGGVAVAAGGDYQEENGGWQPADQRTSRGSSVIVPSVISKMRTTGLSMSIRDTST